MFYRQITFLSNSNQHCWSTEGISVLMIRVQSHHVYISSCWHKSVTAFVWFKGFAVGSIQEMANPVHVLWKWYHTRLSSSISEQPGLARTRILNHSGFMAAGDDGGGSGDNQHVAPRSMQSNHRQPSPAYQHQPAVFIGWMSFNSVKFALNANFWYPRSISTRVIF